MAGRPSKFKHYVAEEICRRLALGESLVKICETGGTVDVSTVFRWLDKKPEFRDMYAHAREAQAEFYANQIIDIADEMPVTAMPEPDGGVTIRIDGAGVQRNKLRVDARKWVAAKLLPRKYGERMLNEVRGNLAVTLEALVCGAAGAMTLCEAAADVVADERAISQLFEGIASWGWPLAIKTHPR